jgi:alpha-1,6-mannosyltransferase
VHVLDFETQPSQVARAMASVDGFVHAGDQESGGLAVLEAMACGTPVVSTEYSDIRRILPFPWQVVPRRSPELLASAIEHVDYNRRTVATAQRSWVENHATAERSVAAMEAVYAGYALRDSSRTAGPASASWTA